MFFAGLIALLTYTVEVISLEPIPVFALLVLLVAVSMIKNQWISFALIVAVGAGMTFYGKEYMIYCMPYSILVWSAYLCKNDKVSVFQTVLAQAGFGTSLCLCVLNRHEYSSIKDFVLSFNKFVIIPIVIIAFIIMRNIETQDDDGRDADNDVDKSIPIGKDKKILMICAYAWSIVFLFYMATRFNKTIDVTLLWVCAMIYVIDSKEPMLFNAFPILEKVFVEKDPDDVEVIDEADETHDGNESEN